MSSVNYSNLKLDDRQNPDRQLNYLQALDVILNTSIDVLSKHQAVVSKKNLLIRAKENLMELGKIIQEWNLHDLVSWKDAVKAAWTFAKAIDRFSWNYVWLRPRCEGLHGGEMSKVQGPQS